jgi:3-hydroxyisobutyrate dehydrogenase-like beta-hydroxyacid dehydrogenase
MTVLLLHPGAMGASIGRALRSARPAEPVLWLTAGRSAETRDRAEHAGLTPVSDLPQAVAEASIVFSVCPPAAAREQAEAVAEAGFRGIYVDANAVAPATARAIATRFERFVDGGIVGPPVAQAGTTRLYLSGTDAGEVAARFEGSDLEVRLVDGGAGAASAVKMAFAAWTKGTSALLLSIRAFAEAEGVSDALVGEWATSMPDLIARSDRSPAGVGPKAWRFVAEMDEIAASLSDAGLADGFHRAAADTYRRLADLKGRPHHGDDAPTLEEVIDLLLARP